MGKTRLAAEFAREVHDQGGWVLYGRCIPEANDPLQPFEQALTGVGASLQDVPITGPDRSPAALSQGLADLLVGRFDRPVLLVLDDLHLAQAPVLEALAGLAAAAATRRLLVLGAYRDEAATPELAALVERLDPGGGRRRRLGPLDRDEVAQVLGLYGSEQAARAAADGIVVGTGGVPLLVHQAASDWAQAQAAHQVEQVVGQTAGSRSHLRVVQARLADDVVDLRELREHSQQVARLASGRGPLGEEEPDDRPAMAVCPYKGLARFEASDAEVFFGRERLVAELVTHLVGAGLVGVVGPSGSGKSSLVRAGLLPALADGVLPGSDRWRQLIVRPGEHPMRELAPVDGRPGVPVDSSTSNATDGSNTGDGPVPGRRGGEPALRAVAGERSPVAGRRPVRGGLHHLSGRGRAGRVPRHPGRGRPSGRRVRNRRGCGAGRLLRPVRRRPRSGRAAGRQPRPGRPHGRRRAAPRHRAARPPGPAPPGARPGRGDDRRGRPRSPVGCRCCRARCWRAGSTAAAAP